MSHTAVVQIHTRVAVAPPPANGSPLDKLGSWQTMPGTPIIYKPGFTLDDTKLSSGEIIVLVARGDIR